MTSKKYNKKTMMRVRVRLAAMSLGGNECHDAQPQGFSARD